MHTCGHRAEGPGVDVADAFHLVDILDVDAVVSLADSVAADVVYSVGSDIAMPTIAAVTERLGLRGFHSPAITETLHRKVLLRRFLEEHRLSPVQFTTVRTQHDLPAFTAYPAIVKPSDSQGQRGITIVEDHAAAVRALPAAIEASATSTAIIEELLTGPEVSVHVFVVNGAVEFSLPSDRIVWDGPMVGVPLAHRIPATTLDPGTRPDVDVLIDQVVNALEVGTGPLYFQLKLTAAGPRIIEIAPRLDGCHLWRLIESVTGFNLLDRCFDLLAGEPWERVSLRTDVSPQVLEFYLGPPDEPAHEASWLPTSERVRYHEFQVRDGELPRSTNPVVARLGYRITEETA